MSLHDVNGRAQTFYSNRWGNRRTVTNLVVIFMLIGIAVLLFSAGHSFDPVVEDPQQEAAAEQEVPAVQQETPAAEQEVDLNVPPIQETQPPTPPGPYDLVPPVAFEGYHIDRTILDCSSREAWTVAHASDEEERQLAASFQQYIWDSQNDCAKHPQVIRYIHNWGIGSAMNEGALWLLRALSVARAYRPGAGWLWADTDPAGCTLKARSLDCYSLPFSVCGLEDAMVSEAPSIRPQGGDLFANLTNPDGCMIAERAKRPVLWVFNQVIHYMLRYTPEVQLYINSRIEAALGSGPGSTIAVHVRGCYPDRGRKPAPLGVYMKAVDKASFALEVMGKPVRRVYFCGDCLAETFVSANYLARHYPRPFEYSVLEYTPVVTGMEVQYAVQQDGSHTRNVTLEYLADVEIMARANVYIGTRSNVYTVVRALRDDRNRVPALRLPSLFVDTAAGGGFIHVLEWLRAQNCPWSIHTAIGLLRCISMAETESEIRNDYITAGVIQKEPARGE